jgi:hypothetical protein
MSAAKCWAALIVNVSLRWEVILSLYNLPRNGLAYINDLQFVAKTCRQSELEYGTNAC